MLVLTEDDVRASSDLGLAVEQVRAALVSYSGGRTNTPLRSEIREPDRGVLALFMPSHVPETGALGCKLIAEFPANRARELPVLTGSLILLDHETGLVDTLMAATHLTNLRTAALTAVAVSALAPPGARTATVLGTGGLSTLQALALTESLDLEEIRVWGRSPAKAEAVVDRVRAARPRGAPKLIVRREARDAVTGADVVVTATSAHEPIVEERWLEPAVLICAVGSNAPDMQELASSVVGCADRVVVDSRAGVITRAGDLTVPIAEGLLGTERIEELGEILEGVPTRRAGDGHRVVFKSCGFAALDMALAVGVRGRARSHGLGIDIDLGQSHA